VAVVRTFEEYLGWLTSEPVVDGMIRRTGLPRDTIRQLLHMSVGEARFGCEAIISRLPVSGRILEIGCGPGILTAYLRERGYDVTGLEPYGYHIFPCVQAVLRESCDVRILQIPAEALDPERHGRFDFIFSINVLEHVAALDRAMKGMASVLAPNGRMWHTCPNYTVPYEPHFSIPLVPFRPAATKWLLPRRITDGELWRGLNFVTARQLVRLGRACDLTVSFERGTMVNSLLRLGTDSEFARRQAALGRAAHLLRKTRLMGVVGAIPPALSTPMAVEMVRRT
jgi:SAM-dependent methyltransferase